MGDKIILLNEIRDKDRRYKSGIIPGRIDEGAKAEIIINKSIRLFGVKNNISYDRTFVIGDEVEYDSYNLSYLGTIARIREKTISISVEGIVNLTIYEFNRRNWDLNLEEIYKRNARIMEMI